MDISLYLNRGVKIPCPEAVEIDPNIPPDRIAPGVVIHSGSRIRGSRTSIGPECVIGSEAPATIENCQLGRGVSLKGGSFSSAVFLDGSGMGSGAHVRAGTLLEEQASAAHSVGLKQTVFLPFVTAGSLINFCDCLMSGGTGRGNHSEIGSSFIHFNFTPRQDKATASLIGDVPRGVMLDRPPIFLGGQGGLVGPVRIAYGTIIAAGSICRSDILDENLLYVSPPPKSGSYPFNRDVYRGIHRVVFNNLVYIGNLYALLFWYRWVRGKYMSADSWSEACRNGAMDCLRNGIEERIKQFGKLAGKLRRSLEITSSQKDFSPVFRREHEAFLRQWPDLEEKLAQGPPENTAEKKRAVFLEEWSGLGPDMTYLEALARIGPEARAAGTVWLDAVVNSVAAFHQPE